MSASSPSPGSRAPRGAGVFLRAHVWLYQRTGGLLGHTMGAAHCLLLTTTGRKSGQSRTQPLAYFRLDDQLVVVASNWGSDRPPAWYLNLSANPRVHVQLRGARWQSTARTATPEERAAFWPRVVAHDARFAAYQRGTTRQIPLVLLQPAP